jgi:DNA repair protein RecO
MPLYACEGVCLRSTRVDEADRLVHYFTDRFGKVRVKIKGITRIKSRHGSIAEPFSHGHLSLYTPREDRGLFSLTQCSLIRPYSEIRQDLSRYYAASFIVELIDRATEDGDPQTDLWELLLETLQLLSTSEHLRALVLAFHLKTLPLLGVGIDWRHNAQDEEKSSILFFSPERGALVRSREETVDTLAVSRKLVERMIHWTANPLSKAAGEEVSMTQWREAVRLLRDFSRHHLDFDPKTLAFFGEIP